MKKAFVLMLVFLCACDNGTVGKCLTNERSVTTTEQDGTIIETTTIDTLLCGCFENKKSNEPYFIIPTDEFSFQSETPTSQDCDRQCVKLCKGHRNNN